MVLRIRSPLACAPSPTSPARTDAATVNRALRTARFTAAELQRLPRTGMIGRIINLSAATASGNEDVVLDLVLNAGFAHPLVDTPYPGSNYIPDLWWRDARLLVEVDSREYHEAPLDQREDLNRQAWLEDQGRTRPQDHQAAGAPRPRAVLPASQSGRSACEGTTRG